MVAVASQMQETMKQVNPADMKKSETRPVFMQKNNPQITGDAMSAECKKTKTLLSPLLLNKTTDSTHISARPATAKEHSIRSIKILS